MPKLSFLPSQVEVVVETETKILVAAKRGKVAIRFGCAACRCGTCAVRVDNPKNLSAMANDEHTLLKKMGLSCDGRIRLACQARALEGETCVDIAFQEEYDPENAKI